MQALKDAQAAKAEAEQDADVIQQQLQQAQAASISKPEALDPPSTPPAPRRTLSGKRASASGLQVRSPYLHASAEIKINITYNEQNYIFINKKLVDIMINDDRKIAQRHLQLAWSLADALWHAVPTMVLAISTDLLRSPCLISHPEA